VILDGGIIITVVIAKIAVCKRAIVCKTALFAGNAKLLAERV